MRRGVPELPEYIRIYILAGIYICQNLHIRIYIEARIYIQLGLRPQLVYIFIWFLLSHTIGYSLGLRLQRVYIFIWFLLSHTILHIRIYILEFHE